MELPKRKSNRLEHFDYSQNGVYFITLCVQNRAPILSHIPAGLSIARPPEPELSAIGRIVQDAILTIPLPYPCVTIDHYVIMPNHVHLLLRIDKNSEEENGGRAMLAPTVSKMIQQTKGYVTKQCGRTIWQKSFYDHVIRDELDYQTRWRYIDENPARWCDDELFNEAE